MNARGAEEQRSGDQGGDSNQSQNTMPAGSGDKDQISACICDLRSIAQFKQTFSSILYNKLEGLMRKKKSFDIDMT